MLTLLRTIRISGLFLFLLLWVGLSSLFAQVGCGGFDGSPQPSGGPQSVTNGQICLNKPGAPAEISILASNVADGNNPNNFAVEIDWDDGSPRQIVAFGGGIPVNNTGPHQYSIPSITHVFLPRPCLSRPGAECSYRPRVFLRIAGSTCPAQFGTSPDFFRFNTDDQCSGDMELSETATGANVFLVCAGASTTVTFTDRTILNCLPPEELTGLNSSKRWRQFVYGTTNTITGGVLIGGAPQPFPYTPAGMPLISGEPLAFSAPPFANNNTLAITIPATAQVNEEFHIRMDYWNFCNQFGVDPAVTEFGIIRVVDQPTPPTATNQIVCNGTNPLPNFVVNFATPSSAVLWYRDNAGVPGAALGNPNGSNNKTFPSSAYPGGINSSTAGIYRVWVSYRAQVGAGALLCESIPIPITITIKEAIPNPGPISGSNSVCNGSSGVNYDVPIPASAMPFGGATEYRWEVVDASDVVVGDVTLAPSSGQGATAQTVSANFNLPGAAFGGAPSVIRKIRLRRRYVNAPTCDVGPVQRVVTVYQNTNAGTLAGGDTKCQGEALTPLTWTPGIGNIQQWEVSVNGGAFGVEPAFGTNNPVNPTTLGLPIVGGLPTTYTYRARIVNGSCPAVVTNTRVYTINPNTDVAAAGADDAICVPVGGLIYPSLGGNAPGVGVTGDWDQVSGPGTSSFGNQTIFNTSVQVTLPGIYVFRWTLDNGTCQSQDEVQISFGRNPAIPVPTANTFCGLSGMLDAVAPVNNEVIDWSLSAGPGTAVITNGDQIPADVTVSVYGTYTFTLEFSSGSCVPQSTDVDITFFEPATSTPEPDKVVCVDGNVLPGAIAPFAITGTVGAGASNGRWEIASGSGTFVSSGAAVGSNFAAGTINDDYSPSAADFAAGSVTLRLVAVHPQAVCGNVNGTVVVTFDKKPADANVGAPFSVCGTMANLNADVPTEGGIGSWSAITAGPSIADPADRFSAVNNLQFGANVFRWSVASAQGVCSPTTSDLTITRTNAPTVNNISPSDLCETVANTGIARNVDLATNYDNLITGGAATVVSWFTDPARTLPVADVNDEDVMNGGVYYVRVSTTGVPVCSSDGIINFTINPKPFVANLNPVQCEETFGGGIINDVDLVADYSGDVALNVGNRSVSWFTDAGLTTPVPTPNDVDNIVDGTTFFARVVNIITGCFDVASVEFTINTIPADNPISGPNTVCLDPNEVIFFKVATLKPNHTYQWTIPPTVTVIGPTTDFYVLLQFPAAVAGGVTIEVQETSPEGCPGVPQQLDITIETNPGALMITGPAEVCEFETDVIYTVPAFSNLTYAWNVPPGASIILGQGSEEVHVNFSNVPGDVIVTPSTTVGCVGPTAVQPVAINERPIMANLDKTVCSQEEAEILLDIAPGSEPATSYRYIARVLDGGLFTLNAPTTPPQSAVADNVIFNDRFENKTVIPLNVRYTVAGTSVDGCEGSSGFITLRVNPEPQLNPLLSRTVCSGEEAGVTLVSAANTFPADRFIITSITIPPGVVAEVPGDIPVADGTTLYLDDVIRNNKWINTTGANQVVRYDVLPYSTLLGCTGSPPTPVNIFIYPRTDVDPVVVSPLCNGDLLNVNFTSANNPDAGFEWLVKSYDPHITISSTAAGFGNITDMIVTNTSLTLDGTITFEVKGRNIPTEEGMDGCNNPVQTFVVTIRKSPIANVQNLSACSDAPGGNTYTADLKLLEPAITPDAGTPDTRIIWYLTDPRLGPATVIPDADLSAYLMDNGVPVFVEVEYLPTTCKKVVPVTYTINPNVSITSTLSDFNGFNLSCNGDNTGRIQIDVQTGSPVYAFRIDGGPFINAGATTYSFNALAAGPHQVEVEDAKGCRVSETIDLIEPMPLTATVDVLQEITCFLGKDGIIQTNASGGTGSYVSYLLLQTNTTDPNNDGIFEDLGAGSYSVRVTDLNNCKTDSNLGILGQPTPVEINSLTVATDANGFNLSCRDAEDGEIEVTFSGGNVPPDYTITLTKASDPLNPGIVNTPTMSAMFTNLGFGNYTVIAADAKGCESLPASAIIVNPPPFSPGFVGINQSVCMGDDANEIQQLVPAFGGVGNYEYQWQQSLTGSMNDAEWIDIPGATSTTYDPAVLAQTIYFRRLTQSVSVRTGIACQLLGKDNIVEVTVNPLPVASFNAPSEVCQGEAFAIQLGISAGTAPIEYDYSAGATTFVNLIGTENTAIPVSNFQQNTMYTLLRVKDLNGCLATNVPQTVNVEVIKIDPDFTVLAPTAQCSGGEFSFQWVAEQGVKYTWIWSDGQQDIINPGDVPLGVNVITHIFTAGSTQSSTIYPVRLQAENALCTPKFATKPITVYPTIVLNISPGDPILCSGETIRFTDQSDGVDTGKWYYQELGTLDQEEVRPGPVPDITYQLINETTTNPIFYEVVYEASNNEGCVAEYRKEIKVYRGIAADIINSPDPPDPFIGGISTVEFTNNSTPLDDNDFEYTWDFGDVKATPPTGTGINPFTVDYFSAGVKDVVLKAINIDARDVDNKTCQSTMVKKINIQLPVLGAAFKATPLASCFPVDIVVENLSPGADTFLWEVFNESGLVTTSNLRNPVFRILQPGTFDIYLTASYYATGQTATANQKGIRVFDVPTALFEMRPNPLYVPDTELQTFNQSVRANRYIWDFDDGTVLHDTTGSSPRHLYTLEGKYNVTLIAGYDYGNWDVDGDLIKDGNIVCYDTVQHELVALDGGFIKLPNAFTPNPGGPTGGIPGYGTFNDVFLPIARGIEEFQMQIFDRWGNLLFESQDRNIGWDGYDRSGRLMPAGVYVFKLVLRLSDGQRTTKIGDVTLIR